MSMRKLFLIMMTVLACTWSLSAQTRTIHGTVVDAANDEPLIGASVMPIGGGNGASADIDGKFTLRVPANVTKAKITYVGYEPVTVTLSDGMVVKMKSSATDLEDFVVVAYGTASKESLTGSVAVVDSKQISRRPVTSVTAALEGNAPGVQISNTTGGPGSSPAILVRGINTINGTTAPLYVVDGVLYDGAVVSLNPNDVESITVLKDAASCALYGSRGANGVILVTTRSAKDKGKVEVTLNVNLGTYNRGIPFYDTMDQNDWMETRFASVVNGTITNSPGTDRATAIASVRNQINKQGILGAYNMFDIYTPVGQLAGDYIYGADGKLNPGVQRLPGYWDTDYNDVMSQHGLRQVYSANAMAATEKMNIFASLSYTKEQGYIICSDFERYNARFNGNFMPTKYLKVGVNLDAVYSDSETANVDGGTANPFSYTTLADFYPYYQHEENGDIKLVNGRPWWNTSTQTSTTQSNLAYVTRAQKLGNNRLAVSATAFAEITLPYGFSLNIKGSMWRQRVNTMSYGSPIIGSARGFGRLNRYWYDYRNHTFYQMLNWAQNYGLNHVDVMLNHENYDWNYDYQYVQNKGQLFPDVYKLSNFQETESMNSGASAERSESYLGRARYNYDQKYFAEASIRRDGSSRFAKNVRWGTFWSVGATWVITKEKFMEALPWVDYAKFRASYGTVGNNAAAGAYAYYDLYSLYGDRMDGQVVAYPSQFGNSKLKWESTKTLDVALEGNLFNNRFNFSIGYFLKKNTDLLYSMTLPSTLGTFFAGGYRTQTQNVCTMQNWGWELSFGGTLIDNGDWRWTAKIDGTFIKNKMTHLAAGNIWSSPRAMIEGRSRYEFWTYNWVGVDQMTGRSLYAIDYEGMHEWETQDPETLKWYWDEDDAKKKFDANLANAKKAGALVEYNGKYYSTEASYATRAFRGSSLPVVYGSFNTSLSWKDLHLDVLITYSLGGKIYNDGYSAYMGTGQSNVQQKFHKDLLKAWTAAPAGMTETSPNRIDPNGIPQVNTIRSQYDNAGSTRWLCSGSWMTMKNIALSYDLPRKWTNAMLMQGITVGVTVENAFSVTARKGINPQYNYSGGQNANYFVQSRTFSFNLTARF